MQYIECTTNIELYDEMDSVIEEYYPIPTSREMLVNKFGTHMVNNVSKMVDKLHISGKIGNNHLGKHSVINKSLKLKSIDLRSPKFNGLYYNQDVQKRCVDKIISVYKWDIVRIVCEILSGKRTKHKFAINFYDDDFVGYYTCFNYIVKTKFYKTAFRVENDKLLFVSSFPIPFLDYNNNKKDEIQEVRKSILYDHNYDGQIIDGKIVLTKKDVY